MPRFRKLAWWSEGLSDEECQKRPAPSGKRIDGNILKADGALRRAKLTGPPGLPGQLLFEIVDHLTDIGVHFHAVFDEAAGVQNRAVIAATVGFADGI